MQQQFKKPALRIKKGLSLQVIPKIKLPPIKQQLYFSPTKTTTIKTKNSKYQIIKKIQSSKNQKQIQLIKQFPHHPSGCTAKYWALYYRQPFELIKQNNKSVKRQIASLTKMMTLVCTLRIVKKLNIDIFTTYFRVTLTALDVTGTMANFQLGQWVSIQDLLYGLMLPSGNDSANIIAQNLGALLFFQSRQSKANIGNIKSIDLSEDYSNIRLYMDNFIKFMNSIAKQLNMKNTNFCNPHGLSSKQHLSTAQDMAILTNYLLSFQFACKIIVTKKYQAQIKVANNNQIIIRLLQWENTNKLLQKQRFFGVKTGHTNNAGACLSSYYCYQSKQKTKIQLIIIILGSKSQQQRFTDTELILEHYFKNNL